MTLSFRICTEADMEIVDPILVAAYDFTGSRKAFLQQCWALQTDGWWLVSLDGTPIGFGGAVDYGSFCYVGMLCIHPSVQNRGIGKALVQQILAWGNERACPTFLLNAKEQAASLYRRSGFIEEGTILQYKQSEPVILPQFPSSSDLSLLQVSDIPELATFDALSFGANRAKIFQSYLAENPDRAFISREESGQITGYIFAGTGSLGPWVANSIENAEQLLVHALSLSFVRGPGVTLPTSNSEGQQLLKRYGFHQQGMNYYMRLGAPASFRQLSKLYGEASPAFG